MPTALPNGLTFAPARTLTEAKEAWQLVYRAYHSIGIVPPNPDKIHVTPHLFTNQSVTICGRIGELCVSTISAYLDHPEHGLPLDASYPDELAALRGRGKPLIEVGLFADRRIALNRSLNALLELIRYSTYFGVNQGVGNAVIGVHPHHAPFYARGMGFEVIGPKRIHGSLDNAPVILMYMEWETAILQDRISRGIRYCMEHPVASEWFNGKYQANLKDQRSAA